MDNYVGEGKTILWTNSTGSDVSAGDLVVLEDLAGVAVADIANGASGTLQITGKFDLPKATTSTSAISQGAQLYYDAVSAVVTTTVGSNKKVGKATEAAGASDATVEVSINI